MKTIDKSKPKNRKCEYCKHFRFRLSCALTSEEKNYWNTCKEFTWKPGLNYADKANGGRG